MNLDARNAELEASVGERPDDPSAALALAAWLDRQGDPRGKLIAVQHALSGATGIARRRALRSEE